MTPTSELLNQALSLPERDRAEFAHRLLLSLESDAFDSDWRQAWKDELAARHVAVVSGQTTTRNWREVIADARKELAEGTGT